MTSSEFQQQVTYQRALEGELAKTISAMGGVQAASVKLAIPKDSVFVSEKADPTASVFVKTSAGSSLTTANVQAIINLVSASIEGMTSKDVAVIDSNGVVLSTVGGDSTTLMQSGQVSDYEQRTAANVQAMLDRVVGVGNAVVSVSAELNYDKTARTTETFTSDPSAAPAFGVDDRRGLHRRLFDSGGRARPRQHLGSHQRRHRRWRVSQRDLGQK